MLVHGIVAGDFIVLHRLIGGPVVLCAIDFAGLKRILDRFIDDRHRLRAQRLHHILRECRLLDTDLQPLHILERADFPIRRIEITNTGIKPGQCKHTASLKALLHLRPDVTVQYAPHMLLICI